MGLGSWLWIAEAAVPVVVDTIGPGRSGRDEGAAHVLDGYSSSMDPKAIAHIPQFS